ncbi:MAG TPA: helix-turn-helix domain-containing protein [Gemmataceae bacterium]|nr:helix-turn-helix domain-containing protein [Gemmataceae bacterium]
MAPNDAPSSPLALRPRKAARALGISTRTLWSWTRGGLVPCVRAGRGRRQVVLYPVVQLLTWLARQAAGPGPGAEAAAEEKGGGR